MVGWVFSTNVGKISEADTDNGSTKNLEACATQQFVSVTHCDEDNFSAITLAGESAGMSLSLCLMTRLSARNQF